ncbi:unnamed protein product [Lathyrus sativus]|nr:unnamed protein product [Lathyrus sativus]
MEDELKAYVEPVQELINIDSDETKDVQAEEREEVQAGERDDVQAEEMDEVQVEEREEVQEDNDDLGDIEFDDLDEDVGIGHMQYLGIPLCKKRMTGTKCLQIKNQQQLILMKANKLIHMILILHKEVKMKVTNIGIQNSKFLKVGKK